MFSYAAISKWMEFDKFDLAMQMQPLPKEWLRFLTLTLPPFEILIVILLFKPLQKYGLWLSMLTMLAFSVYILLGLTDSFYSIPCSCGGILGNLSWKTHLFFNLFYLALSITGIFILQRKEVGKA